MTEATLKKLNAVRKYLRSSLYERDEIIDTALACVVTGQHLFMLGPPGTAKSMLVEKLSKCFTDATYFYQLITKTVKPAQIFGPLDLKELEKGNLRYKTKGYFPDAEFSFMDEIYKGNGAVTNNFLNGMNERKFVNGDQVIEIPLRTMFAASNETPADESLRALYDRFVARVYVDYIVAPKNMMSLLTNQLQEFPAPSLELSVIDQAATHASNVELHDEFLQNVMTLRSNLHHEPEYTDVTISDRRWKAAIKFAKARAWLDGKDILMQDDIKYLHCCLWSEPEQIEKLEGAILNLCSAEMQTAQITLMQAKEAYQSADGSSDRETLVNSLIELEDLHKKIEAADHHELVRSAKIVKAMAGKINKQIRQMDSIYDDTEDMELSF